MSVRSAWLLPEGQTREDTRLTPTGTFAPESEIRTRDGVIAGGNPFAATGAGAMSLQIGVGRALVQGTTAQGAYSVTLDAPEILTFGDGDAQFARVDTVALHVYDQLFDEYGQNLARVEIIVGEPNASPTAPSMPSACLRLWDVTVPAGASAGTGGIGWSSALADRRRFTSGYGGIIPQGWGSNFTGAYDGQYRDAGGVLERWNASAAEWRTYRAPRQVESTTSGFAVASGYTLNTFTARRNLDTGLCSFLVEVSRKGAQLNVPATGNINDETIGTLPSGWRPAIDAEMSASDGFGDGGARLSTSGVITLRTWSGEGALISDRNIRMSCTFFLP
ncbi:hypothetical protein TPA0910_14280 [Streptomyces hygroscopicus subsp. sporocinereus]|uniref:Minor tail protein n=1 Tax=Streptomyces hygroscopicus TaxID=1912 RepID=A0ABQ3TUI4_STRHY|nr:hypothetical protein [Streptomyces hygroscopicus]GHJ26995.1 hypothetical protein TPA0910_14280 [Streptomyces hygroscopicus]